MLHRAILFTLALMIITKNFALKLELSPKPEEIQLQVKNQKRKAFIVNSTTRSQMRKPAIIILHGGGGSADSAIKQTRFDEIAGRQGYIAAFAQGTEFRRGMYAWNTGFLLRDQVKDVNDIAYLDKLINTLVLQHGADPERIYMVGCSNGAMMTYIYATKRDHKLAAIVPIVGAMFSFDDKPSNPLPIMIIGGAKDTSVPIKGGFSEKFIIKKYQDAPYKSMRETVQFWANNNSSAAAQTNKRGSLIIKRYPKTKNGAATISVIDLEGGHGWPSNQSSSSNAAGPIQSFDAANVTWNFVKKYSRKNTQSNHVKPSIKAQNQLTNSSNTKLNKNEQTKNKVDDVVVINEQTIKNRTNGTFIRGAEIPTKDSSMNEFKLNKVSKRQRESCQLNHRRVFPSSSGYHKNLWICSTKGKKTTIKRNFDLVVPKLTNFKNTGLLVVLHGGGGNSQSMANKSSFHTFGKKYNFITVYPQGYQKKWNSGHAGTQAAKAEIDDVHFLSNLINEMITNFKLDKSKVFVTGHSNGAMMAHRLGAEKSKQIAGIAPVAGTVGGFANIKDKSSYYHIPKAKSNIMVFAIHGKCDTSVTYDGSKGPSTNRMRKDIATMDGIKFWADVNKCGNPHVGKYKGDKNLPLTTYSYGCKKSKNQTASVKLLTINDMGHQWPDGLGKANQKFKTRNPAKIKQAIEWGRPRGCSVKEMISSSKRVNAAEVIVKEFFDK